METSRFEHVCQQIFSGECSPLLEILPVDALINVMSNEVRNDADLFAALHALQMDPQYRASPEQRRVLKLNHRNIETERGRM